ncbi:MAG: DinB family protein [Bacteroidetes bacterium]|nr:MAG: DinB family protein [Bacteroidota bacterium]
MTQKDLLLHLESQLRSTLDEIRSNYSQQSIDRLQQRTNPDSWTPLEILAHLHQYAEDYLPGIHRAIHRAKARRWSPGPSVEYTARGRRLIRRGNPENGKPYKSYKRYNFGQQAVDRSIIKTFLIQNEQLLRTLQAAQDVDLNRATVPKAHSRIGKYTLGNLLEFLVLHQRRHLDQIGRILNNDVPVGH